MNRLTFATIFLGLSTLAWSAPGEIAKERRFETTWLKPIAAVFINAPEKFSNATEVGPLADMARLGVDFERTEGSAEKLAPLIRELSGGSDAFAKRPIYERVFLLQEAVKEARAKTNKRVDALAALAEKTKSDPALAALLWSGSAEITPAEEAYMSPDRKEALGTARVQGLALRQSERAITDKFRAELPKKISAGAFDASTTFIQRSGGWQVADESPYAEYPTLYDAYAHRRNELTNNDGRVHRAPVGPWQLKMLTEMKEYLKRPGVQKIVLDEQKGWHSEPRAMEESLDGDISRAAHFMKQHQESRARAHASVLLYPISRFKKPRFADFKQMVGDLFEATNPNQPEYIHDRVLEHYLSNDTSYGPTLEKLQTAFDRAYSKALALGIPLLLLFSMAVATVVTRLYFNTPGNSHAGWVSVASGVAGLLYVWKLKAWNFLRFKLEMIGHRVEAYKAKLAPSKPVVPHDKSIH